MTAKRIYQKYDTEEERKEARLERLRKYNVAHKKYEKAYAAKSYVAGKIGLLKKGMTLSDIEPVLLNKKTLYYKFSRFLADIDAQNAGIDDELKLLENEMARLESRKKSLNKAKEENEVTKKRLQEVL